MPAIGSRSHDSTGTMLRLQEKEIATLKQQNAQLAEECRSWRAQLRKQQVRGLALETRIAELFDERRIYRRVLLHFARLIQESSVADARLQPLYEQGWNDAVRRIWDTAKMIWSTRKWEKIPD